MICLFTSHSKLRISNWHINRVVHPVEFEREQLLNPLTTSSSSSSFSGSNASAPQPYKNRTDGPGESDFPLKVVQQTYLQCFALPYGPQLSMKRGTLSKPIRRIE